MRLGINLNSTLTGRSTYSLRAAYQKTWLNSLGGEWLASAELGSSTGISGEFYQPLDPAQRYFVDAAASIRRESLALFSNDLRISDYRNSIARLDLTAGVNLGMTGQTRLGWRNERQTVEIETGLPLLSNDPLQIRGWLASWETDQKKQLHIATTGWSGKGSVFESANSNYNLLNLNLEGSYQLADWVLGVRGNYAGSTYGKLPVQQMGRLGGFLNLSGFASDQLMGNRVSYGRGETPFGPAYIGLGQSSSGPVNAYLFIGTP